MPKTDAHNIASEPIDKREKAILVGVERKSIPLWEVNDHLDELEQLLDAAGGLAIGRTIQNRHRPDPGVFLSEGKLAELAGMTAALDARLVVFDDNLSPAQTRNLEKRLRCKVIDRAGLILDIFASRARTRESRIQVELAQLQYQLPRLTGRWGHFSRQYGGIGARRGPGETQLELDRQAIKRRITRLRDELARIERARETRRKKRDEMFKVAIIGYTNAGKSSLINALTHSEVFVEDRLFATLDPTVRGLRLANGQKVLLIDTVGFIRKLPVGLLASFRSTLEESRRADLFINVVDISHPHWEGQFTRTDLILQELGLHKTPQILVFNKVDMVNDLLLLEGLRRQYPGGLFISALRGIRLYEILDRLSDFASRQWIRGVERFRPDEIDRLIEFERSVKVVGKNFYEGMIQLEYLILDPESEHRAIGRFPRSQKDEALNSEG